MPESAAPGSVKAEQLESISALLRIRNAPATYAHVLGLARDERNRANESLQQQRRTPYPALAQLTDLSEDEAALLLQELEAARAEGRKARNVCLRCARLGWVSQTPCMHDQRESNREVAFAEWERARGLRSW
jgi:hypothetical protein